MGEGGGDRNLERVIGALLEPVDKRRFMGPRHSVYYYRPEQGSNAAKDLLDNGGTALKSGYAATLTKHCNGDRLPRDKYHDWKQWKDCDSLADYKHRQSKTRIVLMTDEGGLIILLHAFKKTEDEAKTYEVKEAQRLRDEYRYRKSQVIAAITGGDRSGKK